MKNNELYIMVDFNDKYEFPICVADNITELSNVSGFNKTTLFMACQRNSLVSGMYRVIKVQIETPSVERFNDILGYKQYCKSNGLKESSFESLDMYHKECFM